MEALENEEVQIVEMEDLSQQGESDWTIYIKKNKSLINVHPHNKVKFQMKNCKMFLQENQLVSSFWMMKFQASLEKITSRCGIFEDQLIKESLLFEDMLTELHKDASFMPDKDRKVEEIFHVLKFKIDATLFTHEYDVDVSGMIHHQL